MLNPHSSSVNVLAAVRAGMARSVGLWRWRGLVGEMAKREFRARYAGSVLGAAWAVLEPAVQFGLYLTLFSVLLGMRLESGGGVGSFGLYLVGGLVPYLGFQESVVRAVGFGRSSAGLVRHVQVPLEVLLAGSLLAILARHAIAFAIVLAVAAGAGSLSLAQLPWLLVGVPLLVLIVWGLGLALLPAGAFVPDLAQVVATVTTVAFFLTPIVYPETALPAQAQAWLHLNPVVGLVDTFRAGLLGVPVSPARLVSTALFALVAVLGGCALFARREQAVRDVV